MRLVRLGAVLVALMLGCSALAPGKAIVHYDMGKDFVLTQAPEDGQYHLYDTYLNHQPKASFNLFKGSTLGFRADPSGGVIAVAGKEQIKLGEGNYIWKKH